MLPQTAAERPAAVLLPARPSLTVVVPVYNERAAIGRVWAELRQALDGAAFSWEAVFVDDGSVDGTPAELARHGVPHLRHARNFGYGAAVKTGVRSARAPLVCLMDGDAAYRPADVPLLFARAAGAAMTVGERPLALETPMRAAAKRAAAGALSLRYGRRVGDVNSGLRVFRRDLFLEAAPALCDGFSLTASLTVAFLRAGHPVHYVPVGYRERVGTSKVRPLPYLVQFFGALWRVRRARRSM